MDLSVLVSCADHLAFLQGMPSLTGKSFYSCYLYFNKDLPKAGLFRGDVWDSMTRVSFGGKFDQYQKTAVYNKQGMNSDFPC